MGNKNSHIDLCGRPVYLSVVLDPTRIWPAQVSFHRALDVHFLAARHSIVPSQSRPIHLDCTCHNRRLCLASACAFPFEPRRPACPPAHPFLIRPDQSTSAQISDITLSPPSRIFNRFFFFSFLSISALVLALPDLLLPLVTSQHTGTRLASRRVPPITIQHFAARVDQTSSISSLCPAALCQPA